MLCRALVVREYRKRIGGICDSQRGDVRAGGVPIEANRDAGKLFLTFVANPAADGSLEGEGHIHFPPRLSTFPVSEEMFSRSSSHLRR